MGFRMDILFIAPQPFFQVRGTPLAVRRLLESMSSRGHRIRVLTYPIGEDVPIQGVDLKRSPGWPGLSEIPIGPSWAKVLLDIFLFFMCGKELLCRRYDMIHAVEDGAFLAAPWAMIFGVHLVYDMDSNIPEQLRSSGFLRNSCVLKGVSFLERWVIRRSKVILTVCSELSNHALALHRSAVVFQLEDTPLVPPQTHVSIRQELGIQDGPLAVYTGNFEPYQGLELLMLSLTQALRESEDLTVVLVGGSGNRMDWALKRRDALGLPSNRVILLPQRSPENMEPFLREADFFLSPRTQGGNTPYKVFTYLAAGKALLATRLSTHTQVLDHHVALLVDPTPEAFAEGWFVWPRIRN